MKKWTEKLLEAEGYEIRNAQIKNISLSMADHGVLTSDLTLDGHGWAFAMEDMFLVKDM